MAEYLASSQLTQAKNEFPFQKPINAPWLVSVPVAFVLHCSVCFPIVLHTNSLFYIQYLH